MVATARLGGYVGTILIVLLCLSKAYGSLPHNQLIAKLEAYELDCNILILMLAYLTSRK